ncbi:MAG: Jag N-terminal domain-containing protein [Thermodesulfobacteriota bacterium]
MSDFNTFSGKTVDDAIGEACRFFATERDKLEVEIITGGSTGIFGLVGKKKAQIRARRRIDPALAALIKEDERQAKSARDSKAARQAGPGQPAEPVEVQTEPREVQPEAPVEMPSSGERSRKPREQGRDRPRKGREHKGESGGDPRQERAVKEQSDRQRPERQRQEKPKPAPRQRREHDEDDSPEGHDQTPASPELIALAGEIMTRLLTPILEQEPRMEIEGTAGRLSILIQDEEHSGLLIGREGQTLAALQYLANRIMARLWETPVRVQVNTGEYREKQDDNLRKMAAFLADKARNLGRPQSTKPLSSYHRRVIHLALQGDETIQTRSKGDGPMKRVIIVPRRSKPDQPPAQ